MCVGIIIGLLLSAAFMGHATNASIALTKIIPKNFLIETVEQKIKNELKKRTDEAYAKGIFGLPSFVVNNKIFWGHDRLEFALNEAKK